MSTPHTILCVDDESHILHVVSLKLRNAGFHVLTAEDGEEGLAMALEHLPDLVITDYQMPFLTGIELCMQLKQNASTHATPAIMLTARGFSLPPDEVRQTNIVAVMNKPFSPRDVLAQVQQLLDPTHATVEAP